MVIEKAKNRLVIDSPYFSVTQNLYSGQVFRFKRQGKGYILVSGGELAYMEQSGNRTEISCTDVDYFYNYFDLSTDYQSIAQKLSQDSVMAEAVNFGRGVRIFRQPKAETLISFIISANNNIARIQGIIDRICTRLGERMQFNGIEYYAFPEIYVLAEAGEAFYKEIGAGYRAPYLDKTTKQLAAGYDLEGISGMDLPSAEKSLMSFYGVGKKVCDCVLLFAYYRQDVFPVDTWIEKVYKCYFCQSDAERGVCRTKINQSLTERFKGLSGYAQQYLFYYKRESDRKTPREDNI